MKTLLLASAVALASVSVTPALAKGAFDFLDPCIEARKDFSKQRDEVRTKFKTVNTNIEFATAPKEFRDAWIEAKREQARPIFDAEVAPVLQRFSVTDMDKAFDVWFSDMLAAVAPADLNELINTTYRTLAKEEIAKYESETEAEFQKAKGELDSACKKDVGSQVLRVAMAPISWIGGNFEAAKDEHNLVTQTFKAVTGISPKDIAEHGILGGNSELRKLVEAVGLTKKSAPIVILGEMDITNPDSAAGGFVRDLDITNPGSGFRKEFKKLDPSNW
ncbi:hypothetical protein [Chthonobacter rhizosphaerae]|uniref:hypothetical protein n=1 Tax=Chthonobacter rhizosphaerae TaxID=2735553 RepID=UPI0015EF7942|nr:hypothetical protein [Chthonobacter rhizosphaerae]